MPKAAYYDISLEEVHAILDYNPKTGTFTWRDNPDANQNEKANRPVGEVAGSLNDMGYRMIRLGRYGRVRAHRLAYFYEVGRWPPTGWELDHENQLRDDNAYENLRLVTRMHNNHNAGVQTTKKSKLPKGVTFRKALKKKPYVARASLNGVRHLLGTFATAAEASAAYRAACRVLHGSYADLGITDFDAGDDQ